jgi:hypothetical protein
MISRMIEGSGSVLVVVTGPGLIRRGTPQHRINTAIGWWGAFTGVATFAGLTASALISQAAPWRLLWWVMTALTMAPVLQPARTSGEAHAGLDGFLVNDAGQMGEIAPTRSSPHGGCRCR